jgi:AcrR family transcriptional regulator
MPSTTRGRRLRSTPRPRDRREQLAAIAADLFRRHGYHNVGVGDIAAAAGITGPAVYRHFPSKQAILGHVVLSGLDNAAAVVTSAMVESDGSADARRLAVLAAALSSLVVERRELGALWRREGRNLPAGDRAELGVRARQAVRFGVDLVQRVRPALGVEDAELLCWAALSVYGSVSDHHVTLPKARFEGLLTSMALAVVHDQGVPARDGVPPSTTMGGAGGTWSATIAPRARLSRREQLLTLAARMFREHGFHAVTMEDIGAAAGITGPSIYRHYASKADLLVAMCNRIGDRLRIGVEAALAHPPRRALEELTASFVHTVLEYRDLVAAYLVEGGNLPDRDRAEVRRLQRNYVLEWATLLLALDPSLDDKSARVRVHAAFAVVNDIARTARFAARPQLPAELAALALAVLTIG